MARYSLPGELGYTFNGSFPALLTKGFQLAGQVGGGLPLYNAIIEYWDEIPPQDAARLVGIIRDGGKAAAMMFGGDGPSGASCSGCPPLPATAFDAGGSMARFLILAHTVAQMKDGTEKVSNFAVFANEDQLGIDSENPGGQSKQLKELFDEIQKQAEEQTIDESPEEYIDLESAKTFVYFVGARF